MANILIDDVITPIGVSLSNQRNSQVDSPQHILLLCLYLQYYILLFIDCSLHFFVNTLEITIRYSSIVFETNFDYLIHLLL